MKITIEFNLNFFRILTFALFFSPHAYAANSTADGLKILSTGMSGTYHEVIVGNADKGRWVVCWGMSKDDIPLAKGSSLVQGKFVAVRVKSEQHDSEIKQFYCEYEK